MWAALHRKSWTDLGAEGPETDPLNFGPDPDHLLGIWMFFSEAWCVLSDTRLGGCLCSRSGPSPGSIYSMSTKYNNQTAVLGSQRCGSGKSATNATAACAILCVSVSVCVSGLFQDGLVMFVCVCDACMCVCVRVFVPFPPGWPCCCDVTAERGWQNETCIIQACSITLLQLFIFLLLYIFFIFPCHFAAVWENKKEIGRNRVLNINFHTLSASTWGFMNKSQAKPHLFWPHTVHVVKHLCCKL